MPQIEYKIDAETALLSAMIIELTFCLNKGFVVDFDIRRTMVLQRNLNKQKAGRFDGLWGQALYEAKRDPDAVLHYLPSLPAQFHELVFLHCAKIVAYGGGEMDIPGLVQLKELMMVEPYRAEMLIDLAKASVDMDRVSAII